MTDGIGLQGNATISIHILHMNAMPHPPCDTISTQEELFLQPMDLQGQDDVSKVQDTNKFGERLNVEKNIAFVRDPLNLYFRTQILHNLSQFNFSTIESHTSGSAQLALSCSSMASFKIKMRSNTMINHSATFGQNGLDLALFAYDPDEDQSMRYIVTQPPMRGELIFTSQDYLHDEKVRNYYYAS